MEEQYLLMGLGRPWAHLTVSLGLYFLVYKIGMEIQSWSILQGYSD